MSDDEVLLPSDVSSRIGFFDRFATRASDMVSRAPFFAFSLLLVAAWMLEGLVMVVAGGGDWSKLGDETYQLQINSTTTIITFLMVALLQNSQSRADKAMQHKLNAVADGLADLMEQVGEQYERGQLAEDLAELRAAVGLEQRESSTANASAETREDGGTGGDGDQARPPMA